MIGWVLKRPLTCGLAAALLAVLTVALVQGANVRAARERAAAAELAAAEAERRAALNAVATRAVDRVHVITRRLEEEADAEARDLESDPRVDAPIDADLLDHWRGALERLRDRSDAGADSGSGEPTRAVPAA